MGFSIHSQRHLQRFGGEGTVKFVKAVVVRGRKSPKKHQKCEFVKVFGHQLACWPSPSKAADCVRCWRPLPGVVPTLQLTHVSPGHALRPRSPGHHNQWQARAQRGAQGLLWRRARRHRPARPHQLGPDRRAAAWQGRLSERWAAAQPGKAEQWHSGQSTAAQLTPGQLRVVTGRPRSLPHPQSHALIFSRHPRQSSPGKL